MDYSKDILQEISDEDLEDLSKIYKDVTSAPYIYSFINTAIKWKRKRPEKNYVTFYAPQGNWRIDGTFISHLQFNCYDFIIFTKEEKCTRLYEALIGTKRFDYLKNRMMFFCTHWTVVPIVNKIIGMKQIPVEAANECNIWKISKERAINFTVSLPAEVYLSKLKEEHMVTINEIWPHRYQNSEKFLGVLAELSGGYGLFLKESGRLVSWIFKNQMGQLGVLQTVDEFKRRGYGSLLTKYMSREIAEDGHDPMGTILTRNEASQKMFGKLGFEKSDLVIFYECY